MKAKEFVDKFKFISANNPKDKAFEVNEEAMNAFTYSPRLDPIDIEYDIVDDSTIEIHWISRDWEDDIDPLISEITRYSNKIAEKWNLEEDVLIILRIKSITRDRLKEKEKAGYGLTDAGERIINNQHYEHKILIKAVNASNSNKSIELIDISKCKVYTLDGMNIHWWYHTTGKNYARAALFIEKDGSYSINRDDLGSEARLISIGAKSRGDGNTLWSGYHKDEPIKCYKLAIETNFKMDCYIDIETLKGIQKVSKDLFEYK